MDQLRLFGKRLRSVRKASKITQEEAAEKAHLNPKYLGQIERGEKRPSFEAIVALAKALQVPAAAFFQFDSEENDEKTLRRGIDAVVRRCSYAQLKQIYKITRAVVEP